MVSQRRSERGKAAGSSELITGIFAINTSYVIRENEVRGPDLRGFSSSSRITNFL